MRTFIRLMAIVVLGGALAGCFTSREPLIPPDEASFPFERIVFRLDGESDGQQILTREGDRYRMTDPKDPRHSILFRFKDVGNGAYVAQLWPAAEEDEAEEVFLYTGLLERGKAIELYGATKPQDFEALPGLRVCDREVCIDDLDAYAAYLKQLIDTGTTPALVYHILERE